MRRIIPVLCIILLTALLSRAPARAEQQGHVACIINSYHSGLAWVDGAYNAIRSSLGPSVTLHVYDMDTKRIPETLFAAKAEEALRLIDSVHPDIVFLSDDNALSLLAQPLTQRQLPTVYFAINSNPRRYIANSHNRYITGVLERPLLRRSIEYLRTILPEARNITILLDDSVTSQAVLEEIFLGKTSVTQGDLSITVKLISHWTDWQQSVLALSNNGCDALFIATMHRIRKPDHTFIGYDEVMQWTSRNTPVPVFGFLEVDIGPKKAIGGLVLSSRAQGEEAAKLARRILNGEEPGTIPPVTAQQGEFLFSRTQLERWHIILPERIAQQARFME